MAAFSWRLSSRSSSRVGAPPLNIHSWTEVIRSWSTAERFSSVTSWSSQGRQTAALNSWFPRREITLGRFMASSRMRQPPLFLSMLSPSRYRV